MKIGIFGGSFNPPHHDHEQMAKQLLDRNLLDRVIFVPTSNYYPKKGLIDDLQRYELLKIMINGDERLEVSKYEFGRLTYTYQTLEHFQKEYPNDEIYFSAIILDGLSHICHFPYQSGCQPYFSQKRTGHELLRARLPFLLL